MILDNASIHHDDEVVKMIEEAGAKVIYTAPYSPDLNPIELMFAVYKASLKRLSHIPWYDAHVSLLLAVTKKKAGNFFAKCGIPGCQCFKEQEDDSTLLPTVAAAVIIMALLKDNSLKGS